MARKLIELLIDEEQQNFGIDAISLVKFPAIEENFVFFNKNENKLSYAKFNDDKKIVVAPALIPNKQIPRFNSQTNEEYDVYFTPETIKKASELFLKHNKTNNSTYEHQQKIDGVYVIESWIKEDADNDKSNLYGFKLPVGTWFVALKVENNEVWKKVKERQVKGVSIEGFFVDRIEKMTKETNDICVECIDDVALGKIKNLLLEDELLPSGNIGGKPYFDTIEKAELYGELFVNCKGHHKHIVDGKTFYMPCKSHDYEQFDKWFKAVEDIKRDLLAKYPWNKCVQEQIKRGYSEKSANNICGYIRKKYGQK